MSEMNTVSKHEPEYDRLSGVKTFGLQWLPSWSFNGTAGAAALKWVQEHEPNTILDRTGGPAIRWAFRANFLMWILAAVVPWCAIQLMVCDADGVAVYGGWGSYTVWLAFSPFLAVLLFMEFKCGQYVLPAQVIVCGPYSVLGYQVPFWLYIPVLAAFSIVMHMDVFTNGLSVAKIMKTEECAGTAFHEAWRETLNQSAVPFLQNVPLQSFALTIWVLMFSQLLYALGYSIPTSKNIAKDGGREGSDVDYNVREDNATEWTCSNAWSFCVYSTVFRALSTPESALVPLMEASRMAGAMFRHNEYVGTGVLLLSAIHGQDRLKSDYVRDMRKVMIRCLVFFVMESSFWPNLQVTYFALGLQVEGKQDGEMMLSICLSLLSACYRLFNDCRVIMWALSKIPNAPVPIIQREESTDEVATRKSRHSLYCFLVVITPGVLSIIYSAVKFYYNVFVCRGMWNLFGGCVEK